MNQQLSHYSPSFQERVSGGYAAVLSRFPPFYPMGMIVLDKNNNETVYNSDRIPLHRKEARNMKQRVEEYLSSEDGKQFLGYVAQQGKDLVTIRGVGTADFQNPSTVAAILKNDLEGIILSNYDGQTFDERVGRMAQQYGIAKETMSEYVLTHELAHAAGHHRESSTEGFIKDYFTQRVATAGNEREKTKYTQLAQVAAQRETEAKRNEN